MGKETRVMLRHAFAIVLTAGLLACGTAAADPVAEFYKNRTITVISAGEAGGAHGTYAQIISAHIRKHVPGNPNIIIQYMMGAGGNLSMNYLYNAAPKDGTAVGVPLQDLIFNARIGVTAVKYDASKAHYLGGADSTRTTVTVMKSSGVTTLEEAKRKEAVMGASGRSGQSYIIPVVLNALLGTKFKVVAGYLGINAINLAMERGEVQGHAVSWQVISSTRKSWIEKDLVASLVTIGLEREPELPNVPALAELVTSEEDNALIRLMAGSAALGRAWVAFGDIPKDRLAALRDAYAKTLADPDFKSELSKRGLPLNPVTWQVQQDLAGRILATPEPAVVRLKKILDLK
jgi:tripartite-type tricarboxylate transporter receptor subunit TctC